MPNTPAYYPRTKKPRKKTKDERFIKRSGELKEQNERIRGARTVRGLLKDKEAGIVRKKPSAYAPDTKGVLPQSDFAEAQARPEMTPFRAAQLKGQAAKRAAKAAGITEVPTEANKRLRMTEGDLGNFRKEKREGLHDYTDDQAGRNKWLVEKVAKQKSKDSYKKLTGDKQTMDKVKDLQDRIGKLDPGKQAEAWKNVRESGLFDDVIDIAQPAGDIDSIIGKPQTEAEVADAKFKRKLEENEAIYKQAETLNAASKKKSRKQRTADAAEWFGSPFGARIGVEIPDGMTEDQMLAGMSQPERDAYIRGKKLDKLVQDSAIDPYLAMKEFEKVQKVLAAAKIKSLERTQEVADAKAKQVEFEKREVAKAAQAAADIKRKAAEDKAEREREAVEKAEDRKLDIADKAADRKYKREQDAEQRKYDRKQKAIERQVKSKEDKIKGVDKRIDQERVDLSSEEASERITARNNIKALEAEKKALEDDIENIYKEDDASTAKATAPADTPAATPKTEESVPDAVEPIVEQPAPADRKGIIEASGYNIGDIGSWDEGTVIDADKMKFLMAYFFNNEDEVEALITSRKWK